MGSVDILGTVIEGVNKAGTAMFDMLTKLSGGTPDAK
ncbi:hypothetical protein BDB13_5250 [Rhodococcus sp. OK302]|nr:hypothetical protein BDB13_5250 [Rhodococcus sp. OK302]